MPAKVPWRVVLRFPKLPLEHQKHSVRVRASNMRKAMSEAMNQVMPRFGPSIPRYPTHLIIEVERLEGD